MKKRNRIVSVFLVVAMLLPMIVSAPITANAELQANARTTFAEILDFESATAGQTLTEEYVNAQFYAPFRASTLPESDSKSTAFWQVETEEVADEKTNTYIGRKDDKSYATFSIEDPGMYLWNVPFEVSFDVRFNSYSINGGANADTSLLQLFSKADYSKTVKLLGTKWSGGKLNLQKLVNNDTSMSNFNNGTSIGVLTMNEWNNICARVYTDSGRVIVWLNGEQVADFICDEFVYKGIHYGTEEATGSVLGIGSGWGNPTDIDAELDNIKLRSFVDETETFDGFGIVNEYTTKKDVKSYVDATLDYNNRYTLSFVDAEENQYWSVVDDGTGDKRLRQYVPRGGAASGFTLTDNKKDGVFSRQKFEVSFTLNYTTRPGGLCYPVTLMGINSKNQQLEEFPLIYSKGGWVYLYGLIDANKDGKKGNGDWYTGCSTFLLQDIADSEHDKLVKFGMEPGKSYAFRYVIDPAAKTTDSTGATVNDMLISCGLFDQYNAWGYWDDEHRDYEDYNINYIGIASSVRGGAVYLLDASGNKVDGTLTPAEGGSRWYFTPSEALTVGSKYTFVVEGGKIKALDDVNKVIAEGAQYSFVVES